MKITIKSENGQKVVDLKNDLQFNATKGEQYVFSNGFSNYVLNLKDNQESVILTFNVDGRSIKVELNGIVPLLQANTENMSNPTAIIINKDANEKDVDNIVDNNSFDGGEIIDRLEALISKPVELGNNANSNLTMITDYQTLLESLGAAAAGAEAGNGGSNGSTFNSIFSLNARSLTDIADTARWENLSESIANIPVDTGDNTGDRITIFTSITSSDVNENAESVTFNIFLSYVPQGIATTVTVNVTDQNGNVTTYIVDINADGRGILTIKTQDMDIYNDSQSLTAEIVAINGGDYEEVVFGTPVTVNITDIGAIDDVTLTLNDVSVNEGTGTATVGGSLDYAPQTTLVVTLSNGATITFGPDYVVGTTVQSTPFAVQGDDVYKDGQTYEITVANTTGGNFENLVTTDKAVVTVTDTKDTVTLTLDDVNVNEGVGTATVGGKLDYAPQTPLVVTLSNGSTITFGPDYVVGTTVQSTPFAVQGDDVYKDGQTYEITVANTTGGNFENLVTTDKAVVTVTDTKDTVTLTLDDVNVNEGVGTATVGGKLDYAPQTPLVVTLSNGSTITFGPDYVVGTTVQSTPFAVQGDDVYKDGQTYEITVANTTGGNFENLVTTDKAVVTVTDTKDTVTLTLDDVNVNEGVGTATVGGKLDYAPQTPLVVTLSNGSTITFGPDYVVGTTVQSTPFAVQGDDVYKDGQTYEITVANTTGGNFENLVTTDKAVVTVTDTKDTVTLTLDDVNVNEGVGTATVGGKLDYAPQTPLVVTLSNGSTITFGPDYVVGTTVQSTPFAVQGDDVYKDGQTYEITVANTTGGNFENLVTTDKAVVTVTDTKDTVTLTLDDVNVNEGVGTATVGGKLDYAPQTPLVVTLSNGSTITFGPDYVVGTTVQSTPFAVQGDDVYKDGQTYEITVANTTGGNFENLVTTDKAVVTVTDTKDTVTLTLDDVNVNEGVGTATVGGKLDYAPQTPLVVTLSNGSTITFGPDYVVGTTVQSTPFAVQGDDVYKDGQTYEITVANTTGGNFENLVTTDKAVVTVTDTKDTVTLTLDDVNVNEGVGTATVGGKLDYAPQTPLVVTLSNGSTITFGPDYVVGTTVQSTPFAVQGDDVYKDGQTYEITVANTTGGNFENLVTTDKAVVTVTDTKDTVTLTLDDVNVNEGVGTATVGGKLDYAPQTPLVVTLSNGSTITFGPDYVVGTTVQSTPFAVQGDDVYKDGKTYTLTVASTIGGNFENLVTTDTAKVTISDTTDTIIIKIFVSDENGMPLKDTNGNYLTTNSVTEGAKAHYVALAFKSNTTEFNDNTVMSDQVGTVNFKFTSDTATVNTAANASAGSNDYLPQSTLTNIALGKAISMDALDDYISDNSEVLNISIENYKAPNSGKIYEDIILNSDKVVTTILDDTTFGQEDTVYVKIENNASVIEGNALTHTITLVDKFGNPVVVPAGQSIKITLTYSSDTTENEDFNSTTTYKTTEVIITGGNSSVIVKNFTVDDFTNEGKEGYVLKITDVEQSSHYYENVEIHAGKNSVTGEIIDGVSIGIPINGTVDEDNFVVTNASTSISTTGNLGITAPSGDNGYTLSFTTTPTNSLGEPLTSDGKKITYVLNGNTITAIREGDNKTVFGIKLNKNSAGGSDDSYTYTQYENIDHPINKGPGTDDDIVLNFGFNITDQGKTSPLVEFKVTVNDSLPNAIDKTFELNEDTSINIILTEESFSSLLIWNKGAPESLNSSNPTMDIFDPNDSHIVIGKLTYNGAGYVTFAPNPDYSNYNDTPSFKYRIEDSDGDSASGEIKFKVNPVADSLIWTYTNVTTNEDVNVDMNLTLPTIIDNSDDNGNKTGDHAERIGVIELSSIDKGAIIYNGNIALNSGTSTATLKFVIVNADGSLDTSLHYSNINMNDTSIIHLTKAQYENLTITPIPQSHDDITMILKATSYEVDDSGNPLLGVAGKTTSKDIKVIVKSVTDDISLSFDNKNNPDDTISSDAKTYTIASKLEEGNNVINLQSILTPTSGNSVDLDGSEQRSYTVSGIPAGTIITLGGVSAVANSSGIAIVDFDATAEKIVDPTFTMTLAGQFSGKIDATITLKVTDIDDHAGSAVPETKTQTVYLKMNVDPVADQVTLSVSQAKGYEDAGRSKGNTSNDENADDINTKVGNKIPGAIDLDINVKSDDIDGSETFTVVISDIPAGASIYYNGIEVVQNPAGKITIENFNNTTPLQIVPTHNSDEDFNLKVKAYSVDTAIDSTGTVTTVTSEAIAQELTLNVQIKGVADVPVNEIVKELDSTGTAVQNGIYQAVVSEDMGNTGNGATINFADIYKKSGLSSYDNSEDLSVVITGVKGNFDIKGAVFLGGEGESRTWLFDAKDLNNIKISTEKNYSGEIDFKIRYVTTEKEGDSKTLPYENVKILVTPDVDATINTSTSVKEDILTKVNFSIFASDSDETLVQVRILGSDVDGKDFTLYLGNNTTPISSLSKDVDGYYVLNAQEAKNLYVQYKSDLGSSQDTEFNFKYTIKDSVTLSDSTVISDIEEKDATYNLTLTAVTDKISIDANVVSLSPIIDVSTQNGNNVETVTIKETGSFTVDIALNAVASDNNDKDTDGSEAVTRLVVEGVPLGMSIENGTFTVTSNGTNLWFIDIPDTKLDGSYTLKFNVHNTLSNGIGEKYNIKITAYNQDGENSQVTTATTEMIFEDALPNASGGTGDGINIGFTIKDFNVTEDASFSLADIVTIITDTNRTDESYSISFKGLENVSISTNSLSKLVTYEENGETVYVLNIGSADNIETALKSIVFLPEANFNENNDKGEKVSIQPTLTTYVLGTSLVSVITPAGGFNDENVTPVTDAISSGNLISTIDEDKSYTFDIKPKTVDDLDSNGNFSNDGANADGSDYKMIGDITLTHTGAKGVLELSDGTTIYFNGTTTSATISSSQLIGLKFTPDEHVSGTAKFTYSLKTQEHGAINTEFGGGIITINITSVANGLELEGLKAIGNEYTDGINEFIALTTDNGGIGLSNMIDNDGSETIQTILLNGIKNGFLVYYGEDGHQKLAQNAGSNDNINNTWSIPVEPNGTAPQIWIKAPQNWSGVDSGITLKTIIKDGEIISTISKDFTLNVTPVASIVTISPTTTFANAYNWTEINLNANMTDLDGSETVTVVLSGEVKALDGTALFRLSDGTLFNGLNGNPSATYDISTSSWKLEGIPTAQINNVEILYHNYEGKVDVSVKTVDGTDVLATPATGIFDMNISNSNIINLSNETADLTVIGTSTTTSIKTGSGNDIISVDNLNATVDAGSGKDTLVLDNNDTIDLANIASKVKNIEVIDLENNSNQTLKLDLNEVIDITDNDNELIIKGNLGDIIHLDTPSDWSNNGRELHEGINYNVYKGTGINSTVKLLIDEDIDVTL